MDFRPLVHFLDTYLPMLGIPGSETSIFVDREEVFRYSSGYDNPALMTPPKKDALYNLYSCTKVSTMCALLTLLEKGEITLSDPVYAYLPAFRDLTYRLTLPDGKTEILPCKNVMTVRHLMTMTSGLDYNLDAPALRDVYERTDGRCPTVETVSALARAPLSFEPGTDYQYSLSHDVVGAIIEVVSGKSLGAYMKEALFDPIGMSNTGFALPADTSRIASQFDLENGRPVEIPATHNRFRLGTEYESGGAGLISSVDDYVLLADTLTHMGLAKNGNRILSPASVELLRTGAIEGRALDSFHRMGAVMQGYGYGLGVRVNTDPTQVGNLATRGSFGWDGAKLALLIADPEKKVSVFHAEHLGHYHSLVIPRLRNVIYASLCL